MTMQLSFDGLREKLAGELGTMRAAILGTTWSYSSDKLNVYSKFNALAASMEVLLACHEPSHEPTDFTDLSSRVKINKL